MSWFVPLLPDRRRTELLKAILLDGAEARAAWRRWTSGEADVRESLARAARPLLALVYDAVRRSELEVDRETATYLRSAFLTESLRTRTVREVVAELAIAMPFLLIKGTAVGLLWYPDAVLRHAHDVEIVVDDVSEVRHRLAGSAFRPAHDGFVHESGLPVRVHVRLPVVPAEEPLTLPNGMPTLAATDALALALVHASRWISRRTLQWACDAHFLAASGAVDWSKLPASRRVRAQLRWLAENGLAHPETVQRP